MRAYLYNMLSSLCACACVANRFSRRAAFKVTHTLSRPSTPTHPHTYQDAHTHSHTHTNSLTLVCARSPRRSDQNIPPIIYWVSPHSVELAFGASEQKKITYMMGVVIYIVYICRGISSTHTHRVVAYTHFIAWLIASETLPSDYAARSLCEQQQQQLCGAAHKISACLYRETTCTRCNRM